MDVGLLRQSIAALVSGGGPSTGASTHIHTHTHALTQAGNGAGDAAQDVVTLVVENRDRLHNPLFKRPPDARERAALEADDSLPASVRSVIKSLSDSLCVCETDARAYVLSAASDAASTAGDAAASHPFMMDLAPGLLNRAVRMYLLQRHEMMNALMDLLHARMSADASTHPHTLELIRELTNVHVFRLGADGGASFALNCMQGIRTLSEEETEHRATDAVRSAIAIAGRQLLARALFLYFSDVHMNIMTGAGASATAPRGGELRALIELIQHVSTQLYESTDHTDANPLFELLHTLLLTLLRATDFRAVRQDPSTPHTAYARLNPVLAREVLLGGQRDPNIAGGDTARFAAIEASLRDITGIERPHPWAHHGAQGVVCIALGLWFFGAYRMLPGDRDPAVVNASSDEPERAVGPAFDDFPPVFRTLVEADDFTPEHNKRCRQLVYAFLHIGFERGGVQFLSRCVACGSFQRSPLRPEAILVVHDAMAEIVRHDNTLPARDRRLVFRTRRWYRSRSDRIADRVGRARQLHYTLANTTLSSSTLTPVEPKLHVDCLEDILTLQTQLVRASPALACNFWCAFGSAADPYLPTWDIHSRTPLAALYSASLADSLGILEPAHRSVTGPANAILSAQPAALPFGDDGVSVGAALQRPYAFVNPFSYLQEVCSALSYDEAEMHRRITERMNILAATRRGPGTSQIGISSGGAFGGGDDIFADAERRRRDLDLSMAEREQRREAQEAAQKSITDERDLGEALLRIVVDFFAALAAGPLCADGRTCADHLLAFSSSRFGAQRAGELLPVLATALNDRASALRSDPGIAEAIPPDATFTLAVGAVFVPIPLGTAVQPIVQDGVAMVARQPTGCAEAVQFEAVLSTLARTAADLDPYQQAVRQLYYQMRSEERMVRSREAADSAAAAAPLYDVYRIQGPTEEPELEAPQFAPAPEDVVLACLRVLRSLCSSASTRHHVVTVNIHAARGALEAARAVSELRAKDAQHPLVAPLGGLPPELAAIVEQGGTRDFIDDYGRADVVSTTPTVDMLGVLFHLLRLGVPINVKAEIFRVLAAAAHDAVAAARVRDALERYQVLQTVPAGVHPLLQGAGMPAPLQTQRMMSSSMGWKPGASQTLTGAPALFASMLGGMVPMPATPMQFKLPDIAVQHELERVETADRVYESTIAFCELFRVLMASVPMHALGAAHRQPGIQPHVDFILSHVLQRAMKRPERTDRPAERFKMAFVGLCILFDLVRHYYVVYPAPAVTKPTTKPPAPAGGDVAVRDYEPGLPDFDFLSADQLPRAHGSARAEAPYARSPGFEAMRRLLSASDLTACLFQFLDVCGEGVPALEAAFETVADNTSAPAVAERVRQSKHAAEMAAPAQAASGAVDAGLFRRQCEAYEEIARKKSHDSVAASVQGNAAYESASVWKEKCLMLSLAICESLLTKDMEFIEACRESMLPDTYLTPTAELLRRERMLPHITAAISYRNDVRIGMLAARVLYHVCVSNRARLPSEVLIQDLTPAARLRRLDDSAGAALPLSVRFAACLQDDGVSELDEERERIHAVRLKRAFLELAAAALGVTGVGTQILDAERAAPAPTAVDLDDTVAAVMGVAVSNESEVSPAARTGAIAIATQAASGTDPRFLVAAGGVELPLSVDDSPSSTASRGWAEMDVDARCAVAGISQRRATLLEIVLRTVEEASAQDHARSEWLPTAALTGALSVVPRGMSIGHFILGLGTHAFQHPRRDIALLDVRQPSGLVEVLSLLSDRRCVVRRPTSAELCARIMYALLRDQRLSAGILATLRSFMLQWQNGRDEDPVRAGRRFFVERLLQLEGVMRRLAVHARSETSAALVAVGGVPAADDEAYMTAIINAETALLEAAGALHTPNFILQAARRSLAMQRVLAYTLQAAAVDIQDTYRDAGASVRSALRDVLLGQPTRTNVRAGLLLRLLDVVGSIMDAETQLAAEDLDVVAGPLDMPWDAVAPQWTRDTPMPDALATALARHAPSARDDAMHALQLHAGTHRGVQDAGRGARVPRGGAGHRGLGLVLTIGGVEYQTYDLEVVRALLVGETDAPTAALLSGLSARQAGTVAAGDTDALGLLAPVGTEGEGSSAREDATVTAAARKRMQELRACLRWVQHHNAYGLQIQAAQHVTAAWATAAIVAITRFVVNAAPPTTPGDETASAHETVALNTLVDMLQQVLTLMSSKDVAAVVLLPLAELCSFIVACLRALCESARPSALQTKDLVRAIGNVIVSLARPSAVGTISALQPAATAARSSMYAALMHFIRYAHAVPFVQTSAASVFRSFAHRAHVVPAPQLIEACVSGLHAALDEVGLDVLSCLVSDTAGGAAEQRAIAAEALATLFTPTSNFSTREAATRYGVGDVAVAAVAAQLSPRVLENFEALKASFAAHLITTGSIRRLVSALVAIDAVEHDAIAVMELESSMMPGGRGAVPQASPAAGAKRLGASLQSSVDPATGRKRVRLAGGDRDGTAGAETMKSEFATLLRPDEVPHLRRSFDATLSVLACLASDARAGAALLDEGVLGALSNLQWLHRVVDSLMGIRSLAAGMAASTLHVIGAVPAGGEPGTAFGALTDGSVSHPVLVATVIAPRLTVLLQLLLNVVTARPQDSSLANLVFRWLRVFYPLLDTVVQAALSSPTTLPVLSIASVFVRLLTALASGAGGLVDADTAAPALDTSLSRLAASSASLGATRGHAAVAPSSSLDAARADALLLRLSMKFRNQPRAAVGDAPAAPGMRSGALVPFRRDARPAARSTAAWYAGVVPVSDEERVAATAALSNDDPTRLGTAFGVTQFDLQVTLVGEELVGSLAAYCSARCTSSLLGGGNVSMSRSRAYVPTTLFLPPEDVAADALLMTSTPSIRTLLDALEEAAVALQHARLQLRQALQSATAATQRGDVAARAAAHSAELLAYKSGRTCLFTVENLLTVWYLHAMSEPRLRMDAADLNTFFEESALSHLFAAGRTPFRAGLAPRDASISDTATDDAIFRQENQRYVSAMRRQLMSVCADTVTTA